MKIVYKTGNLLEDDADILVNCVNDKGLMGAGIALAFKNKFPKMFEDYQLDCKNRYFDDECFLIFRNESHIICNLLTMSDNMKGSYARTITGLYKLAKHIKRIPIITSIAIPPCGCGIGGLDKNIIYDVICEVFKDVGIELRLYNFEEFNNA
ncbi:MAG: macro domain-containing protein [Bacilli bacterium]